MSQKLDIVSKNLFLFDLKTITMSSWNTLNNKIRSDTNVKRKVRFQRIFHFTIRIAKSEMESRDLRCASTLLQIKMYICFLTINYTLYIMYNEYVFFK